MRFSPPVRLHHGPLSVYVASGDGCADLLAVARSLPPQSSVMWCDSARHHPVTGRWSMLGINPWLTVVAREGRVECRTTAATQVFSSHPLDALRRLLRRYRAQTRPPTQHAAGGACRAPHARAVGLMGYLSYDLNRWIERLPDPQGSEPSTPDMAWCGMRQVWLIDHQEQRSWLISVVDPHAPCALARREAVDAMERMIAEASGRIGGNTPPAVSGQLSRVLATTTQAEFERMVLRVLEHIRAGDVFQANVAQRFTAPWRGSAWPLYEALRRINPSPFACWFSAEGLTVASASPERLVQVQGDVVSARPIAGTRPRGATPAEDACHSLELLLSEKERAEHLMLVDLARNDVGRVCAAGSVGVHELMTLEAYSHVIHIVSEVSGRLRRSVDAVDIIRAMFPGGTITGCPKVRCMEILRELEPVARGLYTGSLGYLGFDGTLDLNIAIRTLIVQQGQLSFHVGAGIVADSVPEREYHETLAKAAALMAAIEAVSPPAMEALHVRG